MAKANKPGSSQSPKPTPPARKPGKPSATAGGMPVNTNLAAESAAKMLMARAAGAPAPIDTAPHKESAVFKQMKENLAKPHLASMDNLINSTAPPGVKKSNLPFAHTNQKGHNQTFGADVTRSGVPRRTPG